MAKNWTLKEGVMVITEGTNREAIQELGKKFPLTSIAIAKMGTNAGITLLFNNMPDHMTMLKMERSLKEGVEEVEEDADVEETEGAAEAEADLEAMSAKELMKLCDKRGIKVPHYGKNKQFYLDALNGAVEDATEDGAAAEEAEGPAYEEMTAVELYKLCKKRGIKVEAKQKASVYVAALKKADAATTEEEDWDEEEEEAPAPAKKASKASEKKAGDKKEVKKTSSKKAEPVEDADDEDDEDDWDI